MHFLLPEETEEEWGNRDIAVSMDYEVKYQEGNILSMVLTTDEGMGSGLWGALLATTWIWLRTVEAYPSGSSG